MQLFDTQIKSLIDRKQFDEAIALVEELTDGLVDDKMSQLRELRVLKAEDLFYRRRFRQSMSLFSELSIPPERVLRLFPPSVSGAGNKTVLDNVRENNNQNGKDEHTLDDAMASSSAFSINLFSSKNDTLRSERRVSTVTHMTTRSEADVDSITSVGADARKEQDVKFFDRFLKPSIQKDEKDNTSIVDTFTNFLSIGGKPTDSKIEKNRTIRRKQKPQSADNGPIVDPAGPDNLSGKSLEKAVRYLLMYLVDTRRKLSKLEAIASGAITKEDLNLVSSEPLNLSEFDSDLEREHTLVDTTMLRCYILINPQLVGPLVRLDNHCDQQTVKEELIKCGRFTDLIDYYYSKKMHREALLLLKDLGEGKKDAIELLGPEPTVRYLQRLDNNYLDIIFEFAKWPLHCDEIYGCEIFMSNTSESESLSRSEVTKYLQGISNSLFRKYLEFIIFEGKDLSPDLHNQLALAYLEDVKSNLFIYPMDDTMVVEPMTKFLKLLKESSQYKPEKIMSSIPRDLSVFWEARAILFSRMGEHKRALEIYVYGLKDYAKAQDYCVSVYETELPNSKTVFHTLLELYLRPAGSRLTNAKSRRPSNSSSTYKPGSSPPALSSFLHPPQQSELNRSPSSSSLVSMQPAQFADEQIEINLDAALDLLSKHGSRLSAADALELLPSNIQMSSLGPFLEGHLRTASANVYRDRIYASLLKAELVRTQSTLLTLRSRHVSISETRMCPVCVKRLGSSVISVFPNQTIVHYGCSKAYKESLE
ncbi:vacuolar sorting protein 39 domain 2-domain-containing protein [Dipodascopsis uninucleata]